MSLGNSARPARAAAFWFVWITVALDILAIGIIIPVLPHLIKQFAFDSTAEAAFWVGVFGSSFALMQFLASPVQGALSDRFGRRPVILLSNLGLGLDFILMAVAGSLPILFLGRVLSGISSASISTANAYIADITPAEGRAVAFGRLGAAFGIGFVLGPALGGVLGEVDIRLPFWIAAGLALLNFLYGFFILPESHPPERRRPFSWRSAHPLSAVKFLYGHRQSGVFALSIVVFLSQLAHYALPAIYVLYTDYRYGWSEITVGLSLAAVGICNALVQVVLLPRMVGRFGERRTLLTGIILGVCGFAALGLAPNGFLFVFAIPLMALWGLAAPATQALMSKAIGPQDQGQLQGSVTSLVAIAGIFGPMSFAAVFRTFEAPELGWTISGAGFFMAALILIGAWALARSVHAKLPVAAVLD